MRYKYLIIILFLFTFKGYSHENKGISNYTFIENKGQWDQHVIYKAEVEGAAIFFESNAFHYQFISIPDYHAGNIPEDTLIKGHVFKANFIGSRPNVSITKKGSSPYYHNYLVGNDETKWKGDVHLFQEIRYENLYNGIDLEVYMKDGFMKYDYHVEAGISPNLIRVNYDGVETPVINDGKLVITHTLGDLIEEEPYAFQLLNGKKQIIECNYKIDEEGNLGFEFPKGYNAELELIIDPVLVFSTYSGSTANNFGQTATYDKNGAGYMGGIAFGTGYNITLGAYQTTFNGSNVDVSISKFSSDGVSLIYSTYLGGAANETVHSLVVDDSLNLYAFGATSSLNFPTAINAHDRSFSPSSSFTSDILVNYTNGADIFVTKLNSAGSAIKGSTFFGGNAIDGINQLPTTSPNLGLNFNYGDAHRGEIVIDSSGYCYVGTTTTSTNLDTSRGTYNGDQDGLIIKFTSNLDSVIWSKYIGGDNRDAIYSLKVIENNKVLIGGGTMSLGTNHFPTTDTLSLFPENNFGGVADGFISIISEDGFTIEESVIIGTQDYDQIYFIEFDRFNNVYGFGQSQGGLFPIKNAPKADSASKAGQFFIKLDRNIDSVTFATTFGNGLGSGTINISPSAFLVDRCQNLYASGWGGGIGSNKTLPSNMPLANNDPKYSRTDNKDFYLYVLSRNADSVLYGSFFGDTLSGSASGDHVDGGTSRFDKNGIIYQSVCASCGDQTNDFPTTATAYSRSDNSVTGNPPGSGCNNALFKFDFQILPVANFSVSNSSFCYNDTLHDSLRTIVIKNLSTGPNNRMTWDLNGLIIDTVFDTYNFLITQPGIYRFRQVVTDTICAAGDFLDLSVEARPDNIEMQTTFDTLVCYTDSTTIFAQTNGNVNKFSWSKSLDFSSPLNSDPADSSFKFKLIQGLNKFYVLGENTNTNSCEKVDSAIIQYFPTDVTASISADTVCEDTDIELLATLLNVDTFTWNFGNGFINTLDTNPTTVYPVPGNYLVSFEYENKICADSDTIFFNLFIKENDLNFSIPTDTLFCGTGIFNVLIPSSGDISTYQWSSDTSFTDTLNSNTQLPHYTISDNDSSTYYLKVSNNFCEKFDSITAEYVRYDLALVPLVDSTCTPYNQALSTTIVGTDSFRINIGSGFTTSTDSTPNASFSNEGKFNVQLIGYNKKCAIRDTITELINVFQSTQIEPLIDTLICRGDTIEIKGNTFGTAKQFIWDDDPAFSSPLLSSTSDSSILVFPALTSNYYFKAENVICEATDNLTVSVEFVDVDVDDVISICLEDTVNVEAFVNTAITPLSYLWSPTDSIISGQSTGVISVAPKNDLRIFLATTSATGCKDFDTSEVIVNTPAFTDASILTTADSIFKGQGAQLSTDRNGSNLVYVWEPSLGLDNPNSPKPNLTADRSTEYKVTITDLNTGCIVVAYRRLVVFEVNCDEPDIFVPSAFTPNNDLSNDVLYVRGSSLLEIHFQLFNRWGELVFESFDKHIGWDGRYKGELVNTGVFTFQLRATCYDGQKYYKKGNITLIR